MIRLIVSDLDGTLMPYGSSAPSREALAMIEELEARSVELVISTGRTYGELCAIPSLSAPTRTVICCDGACCYANGRTVYERSIASEDLSKFFQAARRSGGFILHGREVNYGFGALPSDAARFSPVSVRSVFDLREPIFKVTAYGMELSSPPTGLRMHWDGGAFSSSQWVNRFANKGTALSDLLVRRMLTPFDVACLGDSGNDLPMMRGVKLSVCVGDRSPELASACLHHVSSVEEALTFLLKDAGDARDACHFSFKKEK